MVTRKRSKRVHTLSKHSTKIQKVYVVCWTEKHEIAKVVDDEFEENDFNLCPEVKFKIKNLFLEYLLLVN